LRQHIRIKHRVVAASTVIRARILLLVAAIVIKVGIFVGIIGNWCRRRWRWRWRWRRWRCWLTIIAVVVVVAATKVVRRA
jgi:hypothetical protein